ncbi:MAG: hypothetical protein HRU20_08205 [Pseudomonadales bacterium]|nr:hypothetical protein [Pseudomonadales bacterium]
MNLEKKTASHKIFKRRDGRFSVTTLKNKKVNGEEKMQVLLAEELIKVTAPKTAEEAGEAAAE